MLDLRAIDRRSGRASNCHAKDYCGEPGDHHTGKVRMVSEDDFIALLAEIERLREFEAVHDLGRST